MMSAKKCTVINIWLWLVLMLFGALAHGAQVAGTVTEINGPLLAKKADGTVKILSQKSLVEQGDLLVTEKETYARIKFLDNSEVTLRPNSQFKIDSFSYEQDKPENDSAIFSLLKGGLRAVTGAVGKRSRERTSLNTPAATIGIRGTIYIAEYIAPDETGVAAYGRASMASAAALGTGPAYGARADVEFANAPVEILPRRTLPVALVAQSPSALVPGVPGASGSRAPGLYVQVLDGMIVLNNTGGSQNFAAGQFGFTPSFRQPPIVIPANPGIQFTPPPSFSSTIGAGAASSAGRPTAAVDCEVR